MIAAPNNPALKGSPASKAEFRGHSRFKVQAIHTRFDGVQWFVWDAERMVDGEPEVVRQCDTYREAVAGLPQ